MEERTPQSEETTQPAAAAAEKPAAETPAPPKAEEPAPKMISIDKFFETDLRVAVVKTAERIEGTDKLLRLIVDLGDEERQIVSGLAKAYEAESLVGRRVIVVANLKKAKLRGVESFGMLLAANLDGRPIVASFDEPVPAGTQVS